MLMELQTIESIYLRLVIQIFRLFSDQTEIDNFTGVAKKEKLKNWKNKPILPYSNVRNCPCAKLSCLSLNIATIADSWSHWSQVIILNNLSPKRFSQSRTSFSKFLRSSSKYSQHGKERGSSKWLGNREGLILTNTITISQLPS